VADLVLTVADIAAAARGTITAGDSRAKIGRITIDSRTIAAGDVFVAIQGERFDGHRFVSGAVQSGAAGVVLHDARAASGLPADTFVIQVEDTTRALQDIARHVRRASGAKVVAITGSAGKTTTKEICADLLAARYRVFRNKGNLNNHIGLPLSLLELRNKPEIAVVELGMNHPGEIRTLVGIAEPDVRVWTNVGDAHIGFFESADAIADAKAEILESASTGHVLVANAADPRVAAHAPRFAGRLVTFGVDTPADVQATNVDLAGLDGVRADVSTPAGGFRLQSPLLGLGNLANILAAIAVALTLDVPLTAIQARVSILQPASHRGELLRLPGGITLIDDSYNSSPSALKRSLEVVGAAQGSARKVGVLGEMLELGEHAERLHAECGRAAQQAHLDLLIVVGGPAARALGHGAIEAGMAAAATIVVDDRAAAEADVVARVRAGDLVLVKGSRGIGLDAVVERLKAEFA
jgi:UDP-N-acetylmuramoyl-tripeptide--D-alanyl-D-alanine ligase